MRALVLILGGWCAYAQPVAREQCFPVELLPEGERAAAGDLFLKLLDSEALYTVAGGIKPMSAGFVMFRTPSSAIEAEEVDKARRYLEYFRCGGELVATVHHFARLYPDEKTKQLQRYFDGVVFHRSGLRRALLAHREFFGPAGVTENTSPVEALMATEYLEGPPRLRGLGYLFGYPDYAVDFFVSAAKEQAFTGKFVERDFISMPTFARAERGMVYAVPKGHAEVEADKTLRTKLAAILDEYRRRRAEYIGDGKAGVVAMLRDWFCPADRCLAPVP
jgi:hypothetical protein